MFSSNSYLDNVVEALGMGANGFVSKPFKKETLRHYISDYTVTHGKW
jgi:DNA-binding NtrC family response regulator